MIKSLSDKYIRNVEKIFITVNNCDEMLNEMSLDHFYYMHCVRYVHSDDSVNFD